MAGNQFKGSCKVKVNGALVQAAPNTVNVVASGMQRTTQIADGQLFYQETPVSGTVEFESLWTLNWPLKTVNELKDGLVELEFDDGQRLEVTNALRDGDPISFGTTDGRVKVRVAGMIQLK